MARRRPREKQPLPPPLPPETRTVGQLVAESIRLYGRRFWRSLALGFGPAGVVIGVIGVGGWSRLAFAVCAGSVLFTASYIGAVILARDLKPDLASMRTAVALGVFIFLPAPFLYSLFVLPLVLWFGLVGLAIPAALVERLPFRQALGRGMLLGRVDFVHAAGSLATLYIVAFLTATMMFLLLRQGSGQAADVATLLVVLVISPLVFLGSALLYEDQAARLSSRSRPERSRDADVLDALDADGSGSAHAPVEPRPAAGGQP